jgi:hypothetical protein
MRPWAATITPPQLDARSLGLLCDTITQLNCWYLEDVPETPLIYLSGVRYGSDEDALAGGPEDWNCIPGVLADARRGKGVDCKRLAAWRCAELRVRLGYRRARCVWTQAWDGERVLYHVFIEYGDGRACSCSLFPSLHAAHEDPSAILGMHLQQRPQPALVAGRRALAWSR